MNPIEIANEQIKKRPSMFSYAKNRWGEFSISGSQLIYKDKYNDTQVNVKYFNKSETSGVCEGSTNMTFLFELKEIILKNNEWRKSPLYKQCKKVIEDMR